MNIFPESANDDYERIKSKKIISSLIFGNRFKTDQSLYEYLIEFLLIFSSAKDEEHKIGKFQFHAQSDNKYNYYFKPNMGLRRFIFFESSKKEGTIPQDKEACELFKKTIKENMINFADEDIDNFVEFLQDLLQGYSVILKKRNWCAKQVLPICPEMIFCEAMPNSKKRKSINWNSSNLNPKIDTEFSFDKRNFLARGGEIYYLHLLQALENDEKSKHKLENLLSNMLNKPCKKISILANHIEKLWTIENDFTEDDEYNKLSLSFIPSDAYTSISKYSVQELIYFLSCDIQPVNRIEILAHGVMLQILRMLYVGIYKVLKSEPKKLIIDMSSNSNNIKKMSVESFKQIQNDFISAINKKALELDINEDELIKLTKEARKNSLDIFKSKGKEIQVIIPPKGGFERFSLSENVVRFLVLSLIEPKQKMTLDMFLEQLYKNYGMIIGPAQYKKISFNTEDSLISDFVENQSKFQEFLKDIGFLRELSDATSIVENPYDHV